MSRKRDTVVPVDVAGADPVGPQRTDRGPGHDAVAVCVILAPLRACALINARPVAICPEATADQTSTARLDRESDPVPEPSSHVEATALTSVQGPAPDFTASTKMNQAASV